MRTSLIIAALLVACGPALAQSTDSSMCRLFPLACPGPVPPKPEPLLGPPEDAAAVPAEEAKAPKAKHHARKRVAKKQTQ